MKRWSSFLRPAYAEMIALLAVALVAAVVLVVLVLLSATPADWLLLAPVIALIGASYRGWTASFRRLRELEATRAREAAENPLPESGGEPEHDLLLWAWTHAIALAGGMAALAWVYFRYL